MGPQALDAGMIAGGYYRMSVLSSCLSLGRSFCQRSGPALTPDQSLLGMDGRRLWRLYRRQVWGDDWRRNVWLILRGSLGDSLRSLFPA